MDYLGAHDTLMLGDKPFGDFTVTTVGIPVNNISEIVVVVSQ